MESIAVLRNGFHCLTSNKFTVNFLFFFYFKIDLSQFTEILLYCLFDNYCMKFEFFIGYCSIKFAQIPLISDKISAILFWFLIISQTFMDILQNILADFAWIVPLILLLVLLWYSATVFHGVFGGVLIGFYRLSTVFFPGLHHGCRLHWIWQNDRHISYISPCSIQRFSIWFLTKKSVNFLCFFLSISSPILVNLQKSLADGTWINLWILKSKTHLMSRSADLLPSLTAIVI